jgi:hypothetical protein
MAGAGEVAAASAAMAVLDGTKTLQFPDDGAVNKATLLAPVVARFLPLYNPKFRCNHSESFNVTNRFIAETAKSAPVKCE